MDKAYQILCGCVDRFVPLTNEQPFTILPYPEMKRNYALTFCIHPLLTYHFFVQHMNNRANGGIILRMHLSIKFQAIKK